MKKFMIIFAIAILLLGVLSAAIFYLSSNLEESEPLVAESEKKISKDVATSGIKASKDEARLGGGPQTAAPVANVPKDLGKAKLNEVPSNPLVVPPMPVSPPPMPDQVPEMTDVPLNPPVITPMPMVSPAPAAPLNR
jgi:hypothetical protein